MRRRNAGRRQRAFGPLQPVPGDSAIGDDGGPGARPQRRDAGPQRRQHITADDDVIGAVAERDVDGDIGGMLQWRGHFRNFMV